MPPDPPGMPPTPPLCPPPPLPPLPLTGAYSPPPDPPMPPQSPAPTVVRDENLFGSRSPPPSLPPSPRGPNSHWLRCAPPPPSWWSQPRSPPATDEGAGEVDVGDESLTGSSASWGDKLVVWLQARVLATPPFYRSELHLARWTVLALVTGASLLFWLAQYNLRRCLAEVEWTSLCARSRLLRVQRATPTSLACTSAVPSRRDSTRSSRRESSRSSGVGAEPQRTRARVGDPFPHAQPPSLNDRIECTSSAHSSASAAPPTAAGVPTHVDQRHGVSAQAIEAFEQLVAMGFSEADVAAALSRNGGEMQAALDDLMPASLMAQSQVADRIAL
jgi:hypothetical protein